MLLTTILVLGLNRCWIACRHLVHLLPSPRTVAESQDRRRLQHLTRILMARCVHIQVPPRSGRLLRWFMVLGNFYKNSPLHFAMHTVNLSRHGHRVSWMRWCDGRKTRIPGPVRKLQVHENSSKQPAADRVRRLYDLTAVFPLVKPRSWLNVKFRWSMIRTLRSNFPTEPARGHTMGTPEDSPRMGCTHLNSRWRVLIFRVQLMSFEYNWQVSSTMSFGSQYTWLPCSYFNRDTQKQRRFREGTKRTFTNITIAGTSS